MDYTRKKKHGQKKQLSQSNETLNDVFIGNGPNVNVIETETSRQQINCQHNGFESFIGSSRQKQVI